MDFQVDYAALDSAGKKVAMLSTDTATATKGLRLNEVAPALPGSISGAVANAADAEWVSNAEASTESVRHHGEDLDYSARAYREMEEKAVKVIQQNLEGTQLDS